MSGIEKLAGVKGMNDLLPDQSGLWEWVESRVATVFRQYGYRAIRTPILEPTALFVRGIGEVTDIVEKEMYTFTDSLNGESLTMRPEFTAGMVRAAIEHNLLYDRPQRVYAMGPVFRHERPQRPQLVQVPVPIEVRLAPLPEHVDPEPVRVRGGRHHAKLP
jgi:histidyl-tRNA synthetase